MFRLEVIDFFDQTGSAMVARVPSMGTAAIQMGAQLIVQQNQEAVFFRDGRAMDSFGPGRHTLTTANIPIITSILTMPWEKSPFQACVYFVGKQRFLDQRWGTRTPITMRDPDFGLIRLRSFGKYSFRVVDAPLLINEIVGTQGKLTTEEINNYLKDVVVSGLTDLLATTNIGMLQMAARFDEIATAARVKLADGFAKFGLELTDFLINSISPPEEVQKAIDARSSMSVLGDLRSYTLYQAANGLGGIGAAGAGGSAAALGMGAGIGMLVPPLLQQAMQQAPNAFEPSPATVVSNSASPTPPPRASGIDFSKLTDGGGAKANNVRQCIRELAKQSSWNIAESNDQWSITVAISSLRKQVVHVDFSQQDEAGHALVGFWSPCGSVNPNNALTLLRYNAQLLHGAFAIQSNNGQEQLVLRANLIADTADGLEITRTITAIAWQADQVEEQTLGSDVA